MVNEIKNKHCVMFLSKHNSSEITIYYNQYSLFDIKIDGFFHRYGEGDLLMDLTDKKALKVIGVDTI